MTSTPKKNNENTTTTIKQSNESLDKVTPTALTKQDVADDITKKDVDSSGSTASSGIDSGISGKGSEFNSDTLSLGSNTTDQIGSGTPGSRVLSLCQKGEWMILEQVLRSIEKNHPDLSQADEVSMFYQHHFTSLSLYYNIMFYENYL